MDILTDLKESLQAGDDERVSVLTTEAVQQMIPSKRILDEGLIAGMNAVGDLFRDHEIFLPDVLLAAKAMYAGIEILKPLLLADKVESPGRVVIGSVRGDLHDIGKNLVGIMLKGAGLDVIDLGNDVTAERFVEAAVNEGAAVIGMSALLTTTMPVMKQVVDILAARGLQGRIKTIVGGAPLSQSYAREIGADEYGYDAGNAVDRVKALLGMR